MFLFDGEYKIETNLMYSYVWRLMALTFTFTDVLLPIKSVSDINQILTYLASIMR